MRKNERSLSIVHINTHDIAGGAAKVAWRLAEAQRNAGHDSRMVVGIKESDSEHSSAFPIECDPARQSYCKEHGQLFYDCQGSHKLIANPIVKSADIVHLHNLHGGYFNPFSLSAISYLKPLVWTLHDMQSITGHCAHSFDCQRWQTGCGRCPYLNVEPAIQLDTSAQLLRDKKLIYDHSRLWLVTPSQWLKSKIERSVLQSHPVELIYNSVDTIVFKPCDRAEARKKFGVPAKALVIGAVAHGGALTNQWKGGEYTQNALEALKNKLPDHVFVNIGGNYETDDPKIINIPHINNESELARAYSTLDIFLNTSVADNCPLVILEALSCGIPIVTFDTGGIPELVCDGQQGCVTTRGDQQKLVQALQRLAVSPDLQRHYGHNARERAVSRFDCKIINSQYENLYERILEESKAGRSQVKLFPSSEIPKIIMSRAFIESENSKLNAITPKAKPATPDADSSQTEYDVSIVLCTKDRAQLLDQMLASLSDAIQGINCEVIVVDGSSIDNTLEVLKRHGVTKIYNEAECLGPGRHSWPQLYNFGFSKARGKWAMYASDDILFSKECIAKAVKLLNSQKDEVAGGIFFYKNIHPEAGWDTFGIDFTYGSKLLMNYGLVRLDYFRQVGGLDKAYQFYCADGDLCFKLYESGKQFVPLPGCFIVHNNILDTQKKTELGNSSNDIELYQQRWRHFVSTEIPRPRRLLWQDDFVEAFNLPLDLEKINWGIEYFWQGLACFQQGLFEQAKLRFLQAVKSSFCDHWCVLWYVAKAAYKCGDKPLAEKAAGTVTKLAPNFIEAKDLLQQIACKPERQTKPRVGRIVGNQVKTIDNNGDVLRQIKEFGLWNEGKPLRLHLGCGQNHFDGYINIDYLPSEHNLIRVKADIYADIKSLDFPSESVDEVRLHHVFEHFNRVTALAMLIKWHKWLKIGGRIHIETPDLIGSAKTLVSNASWKTKTGVVRHLAGDQAANWGYHVDHWFAERFEHTLGALGFESVQTWSTSWTKEPYLANVKVTAVKTKGNSLQQQLKAAEKLLWESTVAPEEKPTWEVWRKQLHAVLRDDFIPSPSNTQTPGVSSISQAPAVLSVKASQLPLDEIHDFNQRSRDRWIRGKSKINIGSGYLCDAILPENFNDFTYSKKSHFDVFKGYDVELYKKPIDPNLCDLKVYQDLLVFSFIKENIPKGSRILDIGGGKSRILNYFKNNYECWNLDKLEGIGNGPIAIDSEGYRLVKDYIGCFNKELPDNYFDFVFSISALEHVPEDDEGYFKNIRDDIDRILKPGGYSLHCFDTVIKEDSVWTNKLLPFLFQNLKTVNPFIALEELEKDPDLYVLTEKSYQGGWQKITKKPYKEFGKPLSYNILWQKPLKVQGRSRKASQHPDEAMPIVFLHYGNPDHLKFALCQARLSNPFSDVVLIGDDSNNKYDFITHKNFADYFAEASEFAKIYKHLSPNLHTCELFCIQRWFILKEFMKKEGLKACFHLDSDVLLYADVTQERNKYCQYDLTLTRAHMGHNSFINSLQALENLCDMIETFYKDPVLMAYLESLYEHRMQKYSAGISDMVFLNEYQKMHPDKISEMELLIENSKYDISINDSDGFEMFDGIKKAHWIDGKPYCKKIDSGILVRFNTLHFQGARGAKRKISQFIETDKNVETFIFSIREGVADKAAVLNFGSVLNFLGKKEKAIAVYRAYLQNNAQDEQIENKLLELEGRQNIISTSRQRGKLRNEFPKISVVTPSFNQADYLEECIDSILGQNYPNLEYIIMDGGSTDGSVEIIKKYAKYLTYWQSRPDGGQYTAINEGFKRTSGEIMTWLNSDDKHHSDSLFKTAYIFGKCPDIEWITGRPTAWNDKGELILVFDYLPLWSREKYLQRFFKKICIQQESTFWKRTLWTKAGGRLETGLQFAGDLELWVRFFRHAQLFTVDTLLGGYRYQANQKTNLYLDKYLQEGDRIIDREIADIKRNELTRMLPAPRPISFDRKEFQGYKKNFSFKVNDAHLVGAGNEPEAVLDVQAPLRRTAQDIRCRGDFKIGENTPLTIATSIAPKELEKQIKAIESWIRIGFDVVSINCREEIGILQESFPDVKFVQARRDARKTLGKPFVYLDDFLKYFQESDSEFCSIVNSDIRLVGDEGIISFIKEQAKDSLVYGSRIDVDSSEALNGRAYNKGFDFFFFHKSLISSLPKSDFCIGVPWWDYLVPLVPILKGIPVKKLVSPFAYHIKHPHTYSPKQWLSLGEKFFEYLYKKVYGNIDSRSVRNCRLFWQTLFSNYPRPHLADETKVIEDEGEQAGKLCTNRANYILEFLSTKSLPISYFNGSRKACTLNQKAEDLSIKDDFDCTPNIAAKAPEDGEISRASTKLDDKKEKGFSIGSKEISYPTFEQRQQRLDKLEYCQKFVLDKNEMVRPIPGGQTDVKLKQMGECFPASFHGKRFLEVGANKGFFSMLAAKRGASEAIALEPMSEYVELMEDIKRYFKLENFKPVGESFDESIKKYGSFDIVFVGSVYHYIFLSLRDHAKFFSILSDITSDYVIFEGPTSLDDAYLRRHCEENGQLEFMTKNFTPDAIFSAAKKYFGEIEYISKWIPARGIYVFKKKKHAYRIIELLHKNTTPGHTSEAFLALDGNGNQVCLKKSCTPQCFTAIPRFFGTGIKSHPLLVELRDCWITDGIVYQVMEYLEGYEVLGDRFWQLERITKAVSISRILRMELELLRHDLLFCDLSPVNFMAKGDKFKIIDFEGLVCTNEKSKNAELITAFGALTLTELILRSFFDSKLTRNALMELFGLDTAFSYVVKESSLKKGLNILCDNYSGIQPFISDIEKIFLDWKYLHQPQLYRSLLDNIKSLIKPAGMVESRTDRAVRNHDREYLISAVISTYNSDKFLRGCLNDLEQQTIADKLEIIVINSGSQENEEAIVHEYQQKYNNIVYIKTEQREGIYTAWNRAVKVARGTFLTNANTDDRHREDALEIMAETLLVNPDVALVYGDQICTDTPNGTFANHHAIEMARRAEYSHERLLFGCCVGSQPMWRKSLHTELGYFDDTLTCAGDWDFWLRISISSRYKFKHIPEFLGLYYYNENGIEHGRKIHSLYERYIVGKRYGNPYISVIPLYKSKDNPLVSVIMPAYNAADYIAEAIESVQIQNYRNFELIVIDDGSTDNTKDIVTNFKDDKIKYFYKNNGGPSGARNLAINKSKGQYIMPLDADDMMTPDFIAKHLAEFEKYPEVDLVYCDVLLIDGNSNPIRIMNKPEYQDRRHLIRDLFRAGHPIIPFRFGIKRSVFDKIGFYDEDLLIGEDYDMMRRFVKAGLKAHHLSEPLHLRRMYADSLSRNCSAQKAKSHFDVVKRFTDTFTYDELFPDIEWDNIAPEMRQLHAKCLAAGTYLAIGQEYVKTNAPECSRTAFDRACSELNDCVKMDPENQGLRQLSQKFKLIRAKYTEAPQQVVS